MANFERIGFGQVEPNHLSAQRTGQIYASLPLADDVKVLQNGEFMFYDYKSGKVTADGDMGEPMLVFNEVKTYNALESGAKNFAMIRVGDGNYVTSQSEANNFGKTGTMPVGYSAYRMDGVFPRLFKTNVGDVFTTNMVKTGVAYNVGDVLVPKKNATSKTMQLEVGTGDIEFVVAKVYTMPDGQAGLKLQRVK